MFEKKSIKMLVLLFSFSIMVSSCGFFKDSETADLRKELDELKKEKQEQKNSETEKTKSIVKIDSGYLTLRNAPDVKTGKPIGKIPNGTDVMVGGCKKEKIKIGGREGRWCQTTFKGKDGWVFDAFLTTEAKATEPSNKKENYLITAKSAGNISVGMTVGEARKAMKGAKFSRTSDGDGVALIAVGKRDDQSAIDMREVYMTLFAGEEDRDAPINEKGKIEFIEVWDSQFKTADGVHVKMKLRDVEKIYGKVTNIMMSELESREFADFANGPKDLSFRLAAPDSDAGKYAEGKSNTKEYNPDTYILTISF
jgi:hypothetical protein